MSIYKYPCSFVPPHVLDNLSRRGIEGARLSVYQSEQIRSDREKREIPIANIIASAAPGTGATVREVYDCGHQWKQRVDKVRGEGDGPTGDQSVDQVYEYSGHVRDYFSNVLNRDSIDNLGMDLILNVHYGENFMNAFWDGDEMTFGDGDGNIFADFTKSLDVVAHELTHGVTQFTANLNYFSQSGALNEHFSDVFASAITQSVLGQSETEADWLIGNEIMGTELYGEALRSMRSPGTGYNNPLMGTDPQPDHMRDYYSGPADRQGVHINSGIPNKAFYLTSMEIGTDQAALIWYTALQKLWSTANFNDALDIIVETARVLVKTGKVRLGSPQAVRAAFKAVGLPN